MAAESRSNLTASLEQAALNLPDGLVILDAHSHVVFCSRKAEELTGWVSGEMIGRNQEELLDHLVAHVFDAEATRLALAQALEVVADERVVDIRAQHSSVSAGNAKAFERGKRLGGILSVRCFVISDRAGKSVGKGMLFHDVTRERQADAMKSQLLSTVSHELRTPLASIKGFATTLLRQDVRWDESTQRDFLHIIEEEADRLTEIIDNLLDMSQLEAGMLKVERQPVQMRTIIREIVNESSLQSEPHWFVVDLPSEMPRVLADARRIRQVLHNLLENAVKYSKGGQITLACEVASGYLVVSVSDQGEGIPSEYLGQVFERFFQIDGASTRHIGGSGLGLSISRGIIQAHGGQIWAESQIGQGSTFRFTLPLAPSDPED